MPKNPFSSNKNPFNGPEPIRKGEKIFGRDNEIKEIYRKLLNNRTLLLFSPSGSGKTSMVEAENGMISTFADRKFNVKLNVVRIHEIVPDKYAEEDK
jgi:MoxR-like ATPase